MDWLANLRKFKKESGETYKSISEKTKIPKTTVEKLFSGRTAEPKLAMLQSVLGAMGYTVSQLTGESETISKTEKALLKKYRVLDLYGRNAVELLINHEYDRVMEDEKKAIRPVYSHIYYDFPVSAGTGEHMDMSTAKMLSTDEKPPRGTNLVLRVAGDSMEPEFYDHDYIYVEKCDSVEYGEIGIFVCEGSVYMKEYTEKGLRSLNPQYSLIPPSRDMRCLGRVLGTVGGMIDISE